MVCIDSVHYVDDEDWMDGFCEVIGWCNKIMGDVEWMECVKRFEVVDGID